MNDDDDDTPRPAPSSPGRQRVLIALGVVASVLVCLCGGGLLLARGLFARWAARSALAEHGIVCGDGFDVTLASGSAHAEIAPCTCTMEEGPVESIELVEPVTVDLEGETVTAVHATHLRVGLRGEGPPVEAGSLGPIASMLGVPARIGGLVRAASALSGMGAPPIDVETLDVLQGGRTAVTVQRLSLDGARPLGISTHVITLPGLAGPLGASADVTIDDLEGTASPSDVHLAGDLSLEGTAPIVGTVTRSGRVTVSGSGLDGDAPVYRVEL